MTASQKVNNASTPPRSMDHLIASIVDLWWSLPCQILFILFVGCLSIHVLLKTRDAWRRSRRTSIHRLPPELLGAIFELALPSPDEDLIPLNYYDEVRALALVCRRWRSTVFGTPHLWRVALGRDIAPAPSKTLRLSGLRLLLHINGSICGLLSRGPEVFEVMHRWQRAELDILTHHAEDGHHLTAPAPNLRDLWLVAVEGALGDTAIPQVTLGRLFDSHTPNLRRVGLRGVAISWSSPLLQGLTSLNLARIYTNAPRVPDLLRMLQQCPDLETLVLDRVDVPSISISEVGQPDCVQLPRLMRLQLDIRASGALVSLMARISAPRCVNLSAGWCSERAPLLIALASTIILTGALESLWSSPEPIRLECSEEAFLCFVTAQGAPDRLMVRLQFNATYFLGCIFILPRPYKTCVSPVHLHFKDIIVAVQSLKVVQNVVCLTLECVRNLETAVHHLIGRGPENEGSEPPMPTLSHMIIIVDDSHVNRLITALSNIFSVMEARPCLRVTIDLSSVQECTPFLKKLLVILRGARSTSRYRRLTLVSPSSLYRWNLSGMAGAVRSWLQPQDA